MTADADTTLPLLAYRPAVFHSAYSDNAVLQFIVLNMCMCCTEQAE